MPVITDILTARGQGAYYCEDIAALRATPMGERDRWLAAGVTPGFLHAREVAETLSVGLVLDDGSVAWGDCVGVSFGGKAGRNPVFRAAEGEALVRQHFESWKGKQITTFRGAATELDGLPLNAAVRYGVSQALLFALAAYTKKTAAEVIADEWGYPKSHEAVALQGSGGNDRTDSVDKMIVNRLEALPHGQIDDDRQFGAKGGKLIEWAEAIVRRLKELAPPTYRPVLHFDVHGAVGRAFHKVEDQVAYVRQLAGASAGYSVRLECAVLATSRDGQIEALRVLRHALARADVKVALVADEWANTVEDIEAFTEAEAVDMIHIKMPNLGSLHNSVDAVQLCRRRGVDTLLGGSCIETDISSRASVHVGLATRPTALLIKPGMGINEGISLYRNEMARTRALWGASK